MKKILIIICFLCLLQFPLSQSQSELGIATTYLKNHDSDQKEKYKDGTMPLSLSINANFPDDYGHITIKKSSNPSYKDFYLLNKTYSIKVEISGIGRSVDNLTILEKIDKNLRIQITPPFPHVMDPFADSSLRSLERVNSEKLNESIKESYFIDHLNNTILLRINKLRPKYCIQYNFNITSEKTGVFPATTLVRIAGDASKPSDISMPFEIEVRPPVFEAHIEKNSTQIIAGDPLDITYNIIHKSGWCIDPFNLSVFFKNSTNSEYIIYNEDKEYSGQRINTSFNTLKYSPIHATIYYNKCGKQLLPEIYVEDQVITIPYEEREIYVYDNIIYKFIEEHGQTCATLIGILALFFSSLAILYSHKDIKDGRKQLKVMNKELRIMEEELELMKNESDKDENKP